MFESLSQSIQSVFTRWGRDRSLTEANIRDGLEEIRTALLDADVHFQVARDLVAEVTERAVGTAVLESVRPAEQIVKIFSDVLTDAMHGEAPSIPLRDGAPAVVMMVGLQGSGKTTTTGKLGRRLLRQGRRPLLVAADVRRPAAIRQLQVLGERLDIPVHAEPEATPPVLCANALERARREGHDVILLDTAGRLHIDAELMQELEDIAERTAPDLRYLVCDAMAGQDAYTSAAEFHGRLELDALILTKLDGDTRGGAAISVQRVTGKPVAFIGVGEGLDDLDAFHADRMASRILGMGDVVSLVERAQEVVDEEEAERAAERLLEARFTFDDFLGQLRMLRRLGPLAKVLKMLPGGMGQMLQDGGVGEKHLGRIEAIILSMTPQERRRPDVLDASRRRRIARGSGSEVADINQLLRQFRGMRDMMKKMGGGGAKGLLGGGMKQRLQSMMGGESAPDPASLADALPPGMGPSGLGRGGTGGVGFGTPPTGRPSVATAKKDRKRQKQARKRNRKRR